MGVVSKITLLLAAFILIVSFPVYAATIHGTVYDPSLEPIDALVEINTVPKQFVVAVDGEYSFNVNIGSYVLRANTSEGRAVELIEIVEDGNYTIDMIIGLDIEDPIGFIDEPEVTDVTTGLNGSDDKDYSWITPSIIGIVIMVLLAIIIVFLLVSRDVKSKDKKEVESAVETAGSDISDIEIKTIAFIREHSRITQKELRKMLPYSEAKISLVVAQLESEGKIKKIKKGRGNILVYVKG